MRARAIGNVGVVALSALLGALAGCGSVANTAPRPPATGIVQVTVSGSAGAASSRCHSAHGLPDPHCTPGATYSGVTQRNIGRTICRAGWTRTIRPPESYTERLKREQIAEYGYRDRRLGDYEEDHLIPLELGGAPRAVRNLWPEFDGGRIPNPKDRVENALRRAVCDHEVRLAAAQRAIAHDWKTAEQVLGLGGPSPSPSPSPPPHALTCHASVSDSTPADYTTVYVRIRTAPGAAVVTVAHYRTKNNRKTARANSAGRATTSYYISGATPGFRVLVTVTVSHRSRNMSCSTAFTPHR